jgi:hypothetical protein
MGDLALVPSSLPWLVVVPWETLAPEESTPEVQKASGADGASLGAVSVEVDGASTGQATMLGFCFGIG